MNKMNNAPSTNSGAAGDKTDPQTPLGMPAPNYWFINEPNSPNSLIGRLKNSQGLVDTEVNPKEQELLNQIHNHAAADKTPYATNKATVEPSPNKPQVSVSTSKTTPINPAIINLAKDNNLSVASIAKEANIIEQKSANEVIVRLHE